MYHAQLGRFVSRDPIGYVQRQLSLYDFCESSATVLLDPFGLDPPDPSELRSIPGNEVRGIEDRIWRDLGREGRSSLTFPEAWQYYRACYGRLPFVQCDSVRQILSQGCVGITQCFVGRFISTSTATDFQWCYNSLDEANAMKQSLNNSGYCGRRGKNMCGREARAVIFAFRWYEPPLRPGETPRSTCPSCGCIIWNDTIPSRWFGGGNFDFGYYHERLDCFFHATICERAGGRILCSTPDRFVGDNRSTVYCVTCESSDFLESE
jgi:hypothetical protein